MPDPRVCPTCGHLTLRKCERCNAYHDKLHAHFVQPLSQGGVDELSNTVYLCTSCRILIQNHRTEDWRRWCLEPESPEQD